MQEKDFISFAELQPLIVNRKKNTEGEKVNWFKFRIITYRKDEPFILNVKCSDEIEQKIRLKKKTTTDETLSMCNLPCLYPGGRAISKKKYADLMQLLKYVPEEKHEFFKNLKSDDKEDFGLASDVSEE